MARRIPIQIRYLILRSDSTPIEIYSAWIALIWGIWLSDPFSNVLQSNDVYVPMRSLLPEYVWGGLFLFGGIIQLWSVFSDNRSFRVVTTFVAFCAWLFVATMFWLGNPFGVGRFAYASLSLFSLWAYARQGMFRNVSWLAI